MPQEDPKVTNLREKLLHRTAPEGESKTFSRSEYKGLISKFFDHLPRRLLFFSLVGVMFLIFLLLMFLPLLP